MTTADAAATIRNQLGLSNTPSDWTYDERIAYNKAYSDFVLANADQFPADINKTAGLVEAEKPAALDDTSFSFSDFFSNFLDNAKLDINLGFTTLRNLLFVVAIVATVVFLWLKFGQKKSA